LERGGIGSYCLYRAGLCPRTLVGLGRDSTGLEGGPRESRGGAAHSEAQGDGDKSVPKKGTLLFREGGSDKVGQNKTEDLTWGYKTPQGQLYIQINQ